MKASMHMAVHEAAHAVIAMSLGGYAEAITLVPDGKRDGGCRVSWPDDDADRTEAKLLVAAAGPAATALYKRIGQEAAIWMAGMGDWRYMKALGSTDRLWFTKARKLCRTHWPVILAVADAALAHRVLCEDEIIAAVRGGA